MKRTLSLIAAALLAGPALADTGEDTPRVIYMPCTAQPDLSENGVGPRGAPSPEYIATMFDRTALGEWIRDFLKDETTGYIPGGSRPVVRPEPEPTPELPAVSIGSTRSLMLGGLGLLGAMMAGGAIFRRKK